MRRVGEKGKRRGSMYLLRCDGLYEFGQSSIGVVLLSPESKEVIRGISRKVSASTGNEAEYLAAIAGMEMALEMGIKRILLQTDSQLVVNQIRGDWETRSPNLYPLWRRAVDLRDKFDYFNIEWIPRDKNKEADRLSREAAAETVRFVEAKDGHYKALGSKGQVYNVDVRQRTCTCPDFQRMGRVLGICKHLSKALSLEKD
ncbi:MAG: reverse transcriptase-like protein [bacterium]